MSPSPLARELTDRCVVHLRDEYLPRMERALHTLPADDLWWRPHAETTSVGNLLLHLEGNVRQWILTTLGGRADTRARSGEFAARASERDGVALFAALRSTVEEACEVIAVLDAASLLERHTVQVFENITALAMIVHVTEHFAWHTGQIVWIAKLRGGESHGLDFFAGASLD